MECPVCNGELKKYGKKYLCKHCNTKYEVTFFCEKCGNEPENTCG